MEYAHQDLHDTIVAPSTPAGVGALAVLRLSGKKAIEVAARLFKGRDLLLAEGHSVHFGRLVAPDGRLLDEVLATVLHGPRSYTGDDTVEFSCHGSPFIVDAVLDACVQLGARMARPGEFTLRAFLNGRMNLAQAEAVADLIAADSAAAHATALHQLKGGYALDLQRLRNELARFAALIELELDFGEEDVEFAARDDFKQMLQQAQTHLQQLLASFRLGNAIKKGIPTVIAGRPNAGKSTLLNALLHEERAIVSATPGTTRDTIEEVLHIGGLAFRLTDTAGLRQTDDLVEGIGVQRTLDKVRSASLLVYVFDVSATTPTDLAHELDELRALGEYECIAIANKMDLHTLAPLSEYAEATRLSQDRVLACTAKDAKGIEHLSTLLFALATGNASTSNADVVTNSRHAAALQQTLHYLNDIEQGLTMGLSGDLLAQSLRMALHHLGEITGSVSTDELLGRIFSEFCIGK